MKSDLKIAICGDICAECPRYIATQANDINALQKIAKLWYRLGFRDAILAPDALQCSGCNKDKVCGHGLTSCEHLKNKNNCGECEYFPCSKIEAVFKKTDAVHELCKSKCTDQEYKSLCKAFLMKREILEEINDNLYK